MRVKLKLKKMKRLFLTICAVVSVATVIAGGRIERGSVKSEILGVEGELSCVVPFARSNRYFYGLAGEG